MIETVIDLIPFVLVMMSAPQLVVVMLVHSDLKNLFVNLTQRLDSLKDSELTISQGNSSPAPTTFAHAPTTAPGAGTGSQSAGVVDRHPPAQTAGIYEVSDAQVIAALRELDK